MLPGRGIRTTGSIETGTVILRIPQTWFLEPHQVFDVPELGPEIAKRAREEPLLWDTRVWLACLLVYRRAKASRQETDAWKPYIDSLPNEFTIPSFHTEETIEQIPDANIRKQALKIRKEIAEAYRVCHPLFTLSSELNKDDYSYRHFVWAWACIMTRECYLEPQHYKSSTCKEFITSDLRNQPNKRSPAVLVPCLGRCSANYIEVMANLATWIGSFDMYVAQICLITIQKSKQTSILKMSITLWKYVACGQYRPLDMQDDPYRDFPQVTRQLSPGEQVFIHYGPHDNATLLQYWGFAVNPNPHETDCLQLYHVLSRDLVDTFLSECSSALSRLGLRIDGELRVSADNFWQLRVLFRLLVRWKTSSQRKRLGRTDPEQVFPLHTLLQDQQIDESSEHATQNLVEKITQTLVESYKGRTEKIQRAGLPAELVASLHIFFWGRTALWELASRCFNSAHDENLI